jgi:two-component system phosphate regulon response regulator PhoB
MPMRNQVDNEMEILIFEDDLSIVRMLTIFLEKNGYQARSAHKVYDGMCLLADRMPVLILMDWMLPDSSGIEAIRLIRKDPKYDHIPIIMLTARTSEDDTVHGLNNGADDYVTKPFSSRELLARITANLRKANESKEVIRIGLITLNSQAHQVSVSGENISLGPTEYKLLKFFMTKPGRVFTRERLLDSVWSGNTYIDERTVDVHIRRLRSRFEPYGIEDYIKTVRGAGYIFALPK